MIIDLRTGGHRTDGVTRKTFAELQAAELGVEGVVVLGEILDGLGKFVEAHQRRFIRRPESRGNAREALLHLISHFHGQVVIEQDDHRERIRVGGKHGELLLAAVFENAKFVAAKIAGDLA